MTRQLDHSAPEPGQPLCPICNGIARYEYSGRDLMYDLHARYDYFACSGCACVFQNPMPDMATIASFYPDDYMVFDQEKRIRKIGGLRLALLQQTLGYRHLRTALPYRLLAAMLSPFLRPTTPAWEGGGRMLDVGCGNGRFLTGMRSLGWKVEGVEFSEAGVKAARLSDLPVHHGDLASARFPDDSFDLITARHVIEHIPEPHPFVAELARILRPGGRLVVETPCSTALGRQWFGTHWYANDIPRHLLLFSPANLERLGANHGLRKTAVIMDTTTKNFLNSLDYVLGNSGRPSRKIAWRGFLARIYVWLARRQGRGDSMQMTFVKAA